MCQQRLQTTSPPTLYSLWESQRSLGTQMNRMRRKRQALRLPHDSAICRQRLDPRDFSICLHSPVLALPTCLRGYLASMMLLRGAAHRSSAPNILGIMSY